jgi:DNA primase
MKKGLDPAKFTIKTMQKRIDRLGDLWQPVLEPGLDLRVWLQRLEKVCR